MRCGEFFIDFFPWKKKHVSIFESTSRQLCCSSRLVGGAARFNIDNKPSLPSAGKHGLGSPVVLDERNRTSFENPSPTARMGALARNP
jgi:hypothetical protein